jgi:hypothetical protein
MSQEDHGQRRRGETRMASALRQAGFDDAIALAAAAVAA